MCRFSTPGLACHEHHLIFHNAVQNFLFFLKDGQIEDIGVESCGIQDQSLAQIINVPAWLLSFPFHWLLFDIVIIDSQAIEDPLIGLSILVLPILHTAAILLPLQEFLLFFLLLELVGVDAIEFLLLEGE